MAITEYTKLNFKDDRIVLMEDMKLEPCFAYMVKKCHICQEPELIHNMRKVDYGVIREQFLCSDCFCNKSICKSCKRVRTLSELDGNICFYCNQDRHIKYFNCHPNRHLKFINENFKYTKNPISGTRYYGVEIELKIALDEDRMIDSKAVKSHHAQRVLDILGRNNIILKHDGTIEYGFEAVSAPATYDVQKKIWSRLFKPILIEPFIPSYSCGMHIHVSKDVLSSLQIGKLLKFIYNKKNKDFLETLAGRSSERYASLNLPFGITDAKRPSGSKYEAINYNRKSTVEIRIFSVPWSLGEFYAYLEFFDCLINFVKSNSIVHIDCKDNFINYALLHKKTYRYLIHHLFVNKLL